MNRSLARILPLFFLLLATPALAGTTVKLQAVPSYVKRVLVPLVPGTANRFAIASAPVDAIVVTPPGFELVRVNGGLVIHAPNRDASGYAVVRAGGRELTLTLVTLVPYEHMVNGKIDGYRVGEYESEPLKGLETYERPKGFIRLTKQNESLWVSDHYRMKDFQCKLDGSTKLLILRTEALLKLEILQHELQTRHNVQVEKFTIMSGYRTPYYNAKIGNETSYSRHLYGDAMDIYIDRNGDGKMDDVNRDGRIDASDARFLLDVAASIDESPEWDWLKGGAGVYHANHAHGPYVHVDARGYVARWGV